MSERRRSEGAQARVEWPRDNPPRPLPARPVTFPPYEIRKLANGMQVVLVSQNEQPVVSVRMIIRAGAAHDPKGKHGLAMLTATLLDQGAGTRSAEQIAETIDFIGGVLGTGAGTDLSYVNAVVMKDSYDIALELMADVVAAADVRAGRDRAAAAAGALGVESRGRRSGVRRRSRDRSPDLRLPSVRHARQRHRRVARRH